jgi:predicted Zn-dependent peptidase
MMKLRKNNLIGRKYMLLLVFLLVLSCLAAAQNPDRSQPPKLGPTPTLKIPPVQQFELSNGFSVLLLEKHQVPLVQVNVVLRVGSAMDPSGKSGLTSLMVDMLDEAAGSRNALELADAVDYLGASIATRSSYHTSTVALHTPKSRLEAAMALLSDVALRPQFPGEELERLRKQLLTQLLQAHDEPRAVASFAFNRAVYGNDHPYGAPADLEGPIRSIGVADLKQHHSTYFRPNNGVVIVVGAVTKSEVLPLLEQGFGSWESGAVPAHKWRAPESIGGAKVILVDKPGAAQSEIRIGTVGVDRRSPDYYPLVVMNTILGGSFTSRLNSNLREEHGYAYGAGSSFSFRELKGPFMAASSVQTDATDKSLVEFIKELNAISQEVSDEETTRGKNFVALQFPQRFQSVAPIAGQLAQLYEFGLPLDYFNSYTPGLLAISRQDVLRVAAKHIDPENMVFVIVGDRATTEEGIKALNIGPLRVLTIEDVLGPKPETGN